MTSGYLRTLFGFGLLAMATSANAVVHRVFPGDSIQAAIDSASPGDTILVEPGTYTEAGNATYGIRVGINDLRVIGRSSAAGDRVRLLATGTQETGVYAAPPGCEYRDSECNSELQGFYIRGFVVEDFPVNGIQTRWVDGFRFINNESSNNLNNGIYPTLSANGLVANNVSYGSLDTAMWIAGSENVRVIGNELYGSPTGLEITVANNVYAAQNDIHDNTVGVGLYHPNAAGNPQLPVMANWIITDNRIYDNNLPNPALPGTFQSGLIPGYGVLLLGVSNHQITQNEIEGNDAAGVALLGWCTGTAFGDPDRGCANDPPQAYPGSSNNLVSGNTLMNNGASPPPLPLPGVDLLYFQAEPSALNCFENNGPKGVSFFSSEPDGQLPSAGC
ncbi:MAG: right-handed parallel beta-helix repeat-containing protein [Pseudomonadota bacterium]